jgi:heat shock protein 5
MTKDNNLLGSFELTGLPPAPRGVPQIEVTFEIDVNGLLKVSAVDKATGKSESVEIKNDKGRLSEEQIEQMIKDAEKFADEDKAFKERIEAKNILENYLFTIKGQVTDDNQLGKKIPEEDKTKILDLIKEKVSWMDSNGNTATKEDFEEQKAEVENVFNPITSKLYADGSSAGGSSSSSEGHDEL